MPRQRMWSKLSVWFQENTSRLIAIFILLFILVVGTVSFISDSPTEAKPQDSRSSQDTTTKRTQDQITASVVNILCGNGEDSSGGSGTILLSDGMIMTNAHIIPQNKKGDAVVETCLVTLPDSQGKIDSIYVGEPVLIPYLSKKYDLAFINITDSYTDKEGVSYGDYPVKFPSFLEDGCTNKNPRLGESVRVYGYPAISAGGYYLTITDGVVSSLPNDGTIFISAKINHGSSGGLAVDSDGCMIGVPTRISGDENESLGILISVDVIQEFMNKMDALFELTDE